MLKLFFQACFQVIFLSISDSRFRRVELPNHGFRIEGIAKNDFSWKSFLMKSRIVFSFFSSIGSRFSVFSLENRLENTTIFSDISKSESGN